ncbi:hypothetical protein GCM10025883_28150 [Mobilicoccus caccae]|uniref:Sodium:neurotransmitter symporter family protein n=1 Tax=Mobilicoccus caccae TaxID=1859295 RepID=A0ABQ6ITR7_9MICO|nr:hypothetical protein GCM10025883_28150 [Mobilicoccus caccae]
MSSPVKQGAAQPREQWSGQLGFLLAAIGSAVGLGNIWRFPGVAYTNGGGAFLIPYLVALLTAGIPILLLDYALGHRYRGSAPAVFRRLNRRAEALGWFQVLIAFVICVYYAVIIAWAASFVYFSFTKAWGADPVSFLVGDYLQVSDPTITFDFVPGVMIPLVIVWIVILAIMMGGVQKGLEKANKIFIPLLVILFTGLVIRALTLPGAFEGLNSFFTPDFAALADPGVWIAAYSQIFFSSRSRSASCSPTRAICPAARTSVAPVWWPRSPTPPSRSSPASVSSRPWASWRWPKGPRSTSWKASPAWGCPS